MVSVKVRLAAAAGPLLVTVCVYVIFEPAFTGEGEPEFVIDESACSAVATVVVVVAVLFAAFVSVEEVTVAVSVITVPGAVPRVTLTTGEKVVVPGARLAMVQVSVPPPPTTSVLQLHPPGGVNDWNVVFAGMVSVNVTFAALLGPGLVTTCV
jgi:hypothetical protein